MPDDIHNQSKPAGSRAAHGWAAGNDCDDDDRCGMCGGDGWMMLSDAGPDEWGEDCFCEVDRPIERPECRDRRRYEAQKAKRPNDQAHLP